MRTCISCILLLLMANLYAQDSLYALKLPSVSGDTIHFSDFRGKTILVVNTASSGSRSNQMIELKNLCQVLGDSTFVVVAVPSNDFGHEPKTAGELAGTKNTKPLRRLKSSS